MNSTSRAGRSQAQGRYPEEGTYVAWAVRLTFCPWSATSRLSTPPPKPRLSFDFYFTAAVALSRTADNFMRARQHTLLFTR